MTSGLLRYDCAPGVAQRVADVASSLAEQAGLTSRQAYWLRLAADEITTNIAVHGYRGGGGPVIIETSVDEDLAWLRIEDEAPEFDPRSHDPAPHLAADLATAEEGGFGLLLALSNLDDFTYDYVGGHNRSTLFMRRYSPGPAGTREGGTSDRDTRADCR